MEGCPKEEEERSEELGGWWWKQAEEGGGDSFPQQRGMRAVAVLHSSRDSLLLLVVP